MSAMRKIAVSAIALAAAWGCAKEQATETPAPAADEAAAPSATSPEISGDDLRHHIEILASDEFEGRAPTTPGGEKTRAYIAGELERMGFLPLRGSYFQSVPMVEATLDPAASSFRIETAAGASDLQYKKDIVYWTKRVEENLSFENADMVFVGYGVVAPEAEWNDYAGVDVRGKTVVMLINDPGFLVGDETLFGGEAMTYYGRWTYKFEEAARQGAAAALIIHDTVPAAYGWNVVEGSWSGPQLDLSRADDGASRVMAEGWLSNEAGRKLLAESGMDLDALQQAANKQGFVPQPIPGAKASAMLKTAIKRSEDANVIGVLPGSDAPNEYVLYMGHWDHLGNDPGTEGDDKIYNGAVDNATGIAAILEIAEKFASLEERPRRSIMVAAVTAEESGLLGSAYMGEDPPVPLRSIVGGINIDAILPAPMTKDLIVVGHGASELDDVLAAAAEQRGMYLRPDAEPEKGYFYRSDHISLAKKGVPMLYADIGIDFVEGGVEAGEAFGKAYTEERYHQPSDEIDEGWTFEGMTAATEIFYETGFSLATNDAWPNWREGNEFRGLRDAQRAE